MIQGGQYLGLALESRHACWIAGESFGENFERDVSLQFRVAGAIDLAHTSDTEQRLSFIGAKADSYGERHKG
jgi:hypothetical protein